MEITRVRINDVIKERFIFDHLGAMLPDLGGIQNETINIHIFV